jgi:hypothetical protein
MLFAFQNSKDISVFSVKNGRINSKFKALFELVLKLVLAQLILN